MSYEITGKLIEKYNEVQRSSTFKTREFVIEKSEENNGRTFLTFVKFQCVQDRTTIVDNANIGDNIKVYFNIRGTKWEKNGQINYITNLDAWRIENLAATGTHTAPSNLPTETSFSNEGENDLPF